MMENSDTRYLIKVSLFSFRRTTKEKEDDQYYFEVGRKRRQRTPGNGYFEFNHFEKMNDLKEPLTLYSELTNLKENKEVEVILLFKEKNPSKLKVDEIVQRMKLSHKVGEGRKTFTINDNNLELRIHYSITKTDL